MMPRAARLAVVALSILVGMALVAPGAVAQSKYPPQPSEWLAVLSFDGAGALLHAAPWGDAIAAWPDGAVMGILGEPVVDAGATWMYVQDPLVVEGWMVRDRLTDLDEPVALTPPHYLQGALGGVQPLEMLQGTRACPAGFPVKGVIEGRGGTIRLAFPPEYPYYARYYFTTCFRTLEEARAWGYTYRGAR